MKKIFMSAALAGSLLLSSCMGSFSLTTTVYDVNQNLTGSSFINHVFFWVFGGFVYGVTTTIDVFILNLIEFWTGANPIAMNEGDYDHQYVSLEGNTYLVEATKNQFAITPITGDKAYQTEYVIFDQESKTVHYTGENQLMLDRLVVGDQ